MLPPPPPKAGFVLLWVRTHAIPQATIILSPNSSSQKGTLEIHRATFFLEFILNSTR